MKWFAALVLPLALLALIGACEEEEEETTAATPSPAATATAAATTGAEASPTATPQATPKLTPSPEATATVLPTPAATEEPTAACLEPEEVAPYWPPQGIVTYSEQLPTVDVDLSPIPFDQVQVLATACGDARGQGQETYVAYDVTLPSGLVRETEARLAVLAALDEAEGSLGNIGALPMGIPEAELYLQDVTGDGTDEVICNRPGGATWGVTSIWSWEEGEASEVFQGRSYLGKIDFRDLDGDGSLEVVTSRRLGGLLMQWPIAHRWDGQAFRAALFPGAYDEFIAAALASLESEGQRPPQDTEILHTALGHAYQRQGRTTEASAEYEAAWSLYAATEQQPRQCAGPAEAVEEFYDAIRQALNGMTGLSSAYTMLRQDFRQTQPFPDFAAGFARTEDVILVKPPEVIGEEGGVSRVSVQVVTHELTPQGAIVEESTVTWQVRQKDAFCILESADITQ